MFLSLHNYWSPNRVEGSVQTNIRTSSVFLGGAGHNHERYKCSRSISSVALCYSYAIAGRTRGCPIAKIMIIPNIQIPQLIRIIGKKRASRFLFVSRPLAERRR